jgi:phosphomannomutase
VDLDASLWRPDFAKRKKIKTILDALMLGFSARITGAASIDATKPGDDWAGGRRRPNGSPNPPKFDVQ